MLVCGFFKNCKVTLKTLAFGLERQDGAVVTENNNTHALKLSSVVCVSMKDGSCHRVCARGRFSQRAWGCFYFALAVHEGMQTGFLCK